MPLLVYFMKTVLVLCCLALVFAATVNCGEDVAVSSLPDDQETETNWEYSGKFEGDILLRPSSRNGVRNTDGFWTNKMLFYTISPAFSAADRNNIMMAINMFNGLNCVRMVKRTNQRNYVNIINTDPKGCFGFVGMVGGPQTLNLGKDCAYPGTVVHELLHALGFWHMQNSWNRDKYVTIVWTNIKKGKKNNFDRYDKSKVNDYGVGYDYGSIMHYERTAFSVNGQPTIVAKPNPWVKIGEIYFPSPKDILKLRLKYGCFFMG